MAVVFIIAILAYGSGTANTKLDEYFKFASTSSISDIAKTFHPSLLNVTDPSRLAMFIKAVPAHYGAFKEVEMNGFNFSDNYKNGLRLREYKGNAVFEKGTLPIELSFADEELLGFTVSSGEAVKPLIKLLTVPSDLTDYKAKAEKLVRALLSGNAPEAFKLMSKPLQDIVGNGKLEQHCKNYSSNGALKNVEFIGKYNGQTKADELILLFKCSIGEHIITAEVSYKFQNLDSYLIGYEIPSSKTNN